MKKRLPAWRRRLIEFMDERDPEGLTKLDEPERCPRCGSPTSVRKPGSCINADCPLWEGPFA